MAKKSGKKWKKAQKAADKKMTGGKADDIIIPVMGATGVGKSTFINTYMGRDVARAGSSLQSCTANVEHYIHRLSSGRRIVLVDTPGFNDTYEDESEILRRVAVWLASSYDEGMTIAGAVYLGDISQKRMYGSTQMNLGMFQGMCGPKFYSKIIMATTHWDTVPQGVATQREKEMKENFWKDILRQGATVKRVQTRPKDIHDIVNTIVSNHVSAESSSSRSQGNGAMELQKELVDLDKIIPMTHAGQQLKVNLKEFLEMQKQVEATEGDDHKKQALKEKMAVIQQQLRELKVPFSVRFMSFFGLVRPSVLRA